MTKNARDFHLVLNPQEGVNDTHATLLTWQAQDGDIVSVGTVLCELQTAKATYDLVAPVPGLIKTIAAAGEKVAVGQSVAAIFGSATSYTAHGEAVVREERVKQAAPTVQITDKARKLAESLGVDVQQIVSDAGIIKEKDVRRHHELMSTGTSGPRGEVNGKFLDTLRSDSTFRTLSSDEKIKRYRDNGALVGTGVTIGAGTIIIARFIEIGEGCHFGDSAYVMAERFRIGKLGVIGRAADIVTRTVSIGDVFFSGSGILIGGGGAFEKHAEFRCGDNCLVSSECIINTGEGVVLGDEVGLSPRVQIYTHSHWQDVFDGYSPVFGGVSIGDQSYITGSAMIVPGVKIGRGCMVLANSVVTADVEDRNIVSGVPATVVGSVEGNLSLEKKDRIMRRLLPELRQRLSDQSLDPGGFTYTMQLIGDVSSPVALTFEFSGDKAPSGTVVFDFGRKEIFGEENRYTDEIRNFFRKRGVRFRPYAWRYTHDAGLFNQ